MLAASRPLPPPSAGFALSFGPSRGLRASRAGRAGAFANGDDATMPPASSTAADREAATVNLYRAFENRTVFAEPEKRRLPTTLVTGWLGSGKTTVMRHVLANRQDLRVACAVNDFAELNIDAELVAREDTGARTPGADEGVVELTNGCLCCTLGGELETEVWRMLDAGARREADGTGAVDYLLIETSGLVDPTETVAALDKTFGKLARVRLDSVVCVVDAESAALGGVGSAPVGPDASGSDAAAEAWARQLSAADVVLLNKIDLLGEEEEEGKEEAKENPSTRDPAAASGPASRRSRLDAARAFVRRWAPDAKIVECVRGEAPLPAILDVELAPQPEGKVGHDWDSAARPFLLSPTGGALRKSAAGSSTKGGPFIIDPAARRSSHLRRTSDASGEFGSASYLGGFASLAGFQRWAKRGIPPGVARAKGFVTFAEDPDVTYDFHLSGRRRVEIEPSESRGADARGARATRARAARRFGAAAAAAASKPATEEGNAPARGEEATRIVLIGPGLDPNSATAALREIEVAGDDVGAEPREGLGGGDAAAARLRRATALVEADARLELAEATDEWCSRRAAATCVHFRLTGARSNGMTAREMERDHGVDFNRVQAELARAVNAGGGDGVAIVATRHGWTTRFGAPALVVRVGVDVGGDGGGAIEAWGDITEACTRVLRRHIAHIPKCRCGF